MTKLPQTPRQRGLLSYHLSTIPDDEDRSAAVAMGLLDKNCEIVEQVILILTSIKEISRNLDLESNTNLSTTFADSADMDQQTDLSTTLADLADMGRQKASEIREGEEAIFDILAEVA